LRSDQLSLFKKQDMNWENRISLTFNTAGLSAMQQELMPLLLAENIITQDLEAMDEEQQAEFAKMLNKAIEEVNREYTRLTGLMGQTMRMPVKQLAWENNHLKISKAIELGLLRTGRTPNQTQIAAATGLSRKTVQDHLAQGNDNSVFAEHLRQYNMMAPVVMDIVLHKIIDSADMKAVKMYYEILEKLNGPNAQNIYNTHNNYIQINNHVISQEALGRLSEEQLKQIVEMVRVKEDDMTREEPTKE
jgi:hypothetical protein